jgi:hypothetical protein
MLEETAQLEALRQKIEDAEFEAGDQSDFLDYGKPNKEQAKQAQALIARRNAEGQVLKEDLKSLLAALRAQKPQAIDEWVNFHSGILQKIMEEKASDANAKTRQNVAKGTLQAWEKVRAGEQDYVGINGHFLKDYKASVRKSGGTGMVGNRAKTDDKAWWQFWK